MFEKISMYAFCINVLIGIIAFGYLLYQLIGYWGLFVTGVIYLPLVLLGVKPATKEVKM